MDIKIPYTPRPQQYDLHADQSRFKICVSHRRWGKSVYAVTELLRKALEIKTERQDGRFMYLAPYYRQAKQVAWDYLCYYTKDMPGTKINQSELRVDLINGSRIRLAGAGDDPDALRGIFLDGVVLDEYADMSPRVWSEIIRPALVDRKGWAIFIGTPKYIEEYLYKLKLKFDYVVFDEIHNLDDKYENLIKLIGCNFVALSATIKNIDFVIDIFNKINPEKFRILGGHGYYFPTWEIAKELLDSVDTKKKMRALDTEMVKLQRSGKIKYFYYPALSYLNMEDAKKGVHAIHMDRDMKKY